MFVIRLKRTGRKNQPSFRVIVTLKQAGGPAGKPKEYLGWFNPFLKTFELKKERISYWLSQGAKPSETMHNLLLKAGFIEGKKIPLHGKEKHPEEAVKAAAPESGESLASSPSQNGRPAAEPEKAGETAKMAVAPAVEAKTETTEPVPAEEAKTES